MQHSNAKSGMSDGMTRAHYRTFALNLIVSAVIMYFVMFTMIYGLSEFYNNLNMAYMAIMMAAPMGMLMLVMMGSMYNDRRLNLVLLGGFALLFALAFWGMRAQGLVGDRQFLRAMIPHHSAAIQMVNASSLTDPRVKKLGEDIVASQEREIAEMKALLEERN